MLSCGIRGEQKRYAGHIIVLIYFVDKKWYEQLFFIGRLRSHPKVESKNGPHQTVCLIFILPSIVFCDTFKKSWFRGQTLTNTKRDPG